MEDVVLLENAFVQMSFGAVNVRKVELLTIYIKALSHTILIVVNYILITFFFDNTTFLNMKTTNMPHYPQHTDEIVKTVTGK